MVSDRFKPGTKVYYVSSYTGEKHYGVVGGKEEIERKDSEVFRPGNYRIRAVWAYWEGNTELSYMREDEVFLDEPKYKRNLPSWF